MKFKVYRELILIRRTEDLEGCEKKQKNITRYHHQWSVLFGEVLGDKVQAKCRAEINKKKVKIYYSYKEHIRQLIKKNQTNSDIIYSLNARDKQPDRKEVPLVPRKSV